MIAQRYKDAGDPLRHQSVAPVGTVAAHRVAPYASFAEIYDFLIGSPALPLLHAAFARRIRRFGLKFASLADIRRGTGAFLATLACGPAALTGVDASARMLAIARRRLGRCPVTLLRQDIRRLALPHRVDLITCHNQTINYLAAPGELVRVFAIVARNLRRNGAFVFDFLARAAEMSRMAPARWRETVRLPDHEVQFGSIVDAARGASTVRICITDRRRPHRRSVEMHRQRWFWPATVVRSLRASGFRTLSINPVNGSDDTWLHVVAQRN